MAVNLSHPITAVSLLLCLYDTSSSFSSFLASDVDHLWLLLVLWECIIGIYSGKYYLKILFGDFCLEIFAWSMSRRGRQLFLFMAGVRE
jgi:hypothetical protein